MKAKTKNKRKVGRPTKATPQRIKAILHDLTLGMTEEQAVAGNGVAESTWHAWKNRPEFIGLRAKAQHHRITYLMAAKEAAAREGNQCYKSYSWDLERIFKGQYDNPDKVAIQLNQQINNNTLAISGDELAAARKELDEIRQQQLRRESERSENHQETNGRRPVMRELEAPAGNEEPEPEPERVPQSGHSMRESDIDPSSGEPRKIGRPHEPSQRQGLLVQQRRMGRADGDGKDIF